MTETEFRVEYSELIEFYQYIEEHLKYICASLLADEQKGWFERLNDLESDPFGMLIKKIQQLQNDKQIVILSDEDIKELDDVRNSRNYWIHQCFGGMTSPVVFRKGELRRPEHGKRLRADLSIAIEWDERLANKMREGRETI